MKIPTLIDERQSSWIERKKAKKKYDSILSLSNAAKEDMDVGIALKAKESNGTYTARLLDEGMVVFSDGSPRMYLQKGVLKEFYDSLSEDYVGYINLGHVDFATDPIFLGSWSKADLTLVDIGDGRQGLDVTFKLDDRLSKVKDLKLMNFTMAVSAEFNASVNWNVMEFMEVDFPIYDHVYIPGFGIVGDPGNINSAGLELKGEKTMTKGKKSFSETFEELFSKLTKTPDPKPEGQEEKTKLSAEELGGLSIEKMSEIADEFERLKAVEVQAEQMAEKGVELFEELESAKKELAAAKEKLAEYDKKVPTVFERFANIANDLGDKHENQKEQLKKESEELTGFEAAKAKLKALEKEGE